MQFLRKKKLTIMIDYGDGNGNQYIIEQDTIEYIPVKPKYNSKFLNLPVNIL